MDVVVQMLNPAVTKLLDTAGLSERACDDGIGVDAHIRMLLRSAYTAKEVAAGLSISLSRVHRQRRVRALWGIDHAHTWRFPAVQFIVAAGRPVRQVRGLDLVFRALPTDLHPLAINGFLHTPQPDLAIGGELASPLDWLRAGQPATAVVTSAAALHWYG